MLLWSRHADADQLFERGFYLVNLRLAWPRAGNSLRVDSLREVVAVARGNVMRSTHRESSVLRRTVQCVLTSGLLCGAFSVHAQSAGGTLRGDVHGAESAPAAVTATNTLTGFSRTVQSGTNG